MERKRKKDAHVKNLFRDPSGQNELFEKSYQEELEAKAKKQVECLGMTFENDEARRAYFLEKLKEKLKDPEFRKIEGFPSARTRTSWHSLTRRIIPHARTHSSRISSGAMVSHTTQKSQLPPRAICR